MATFPIVKIRQANDSDTHTEAFPNIYLFYKKHGYIDMPFNNPDGEAPLMNGRQGNIYEPKAFTR